MPTTAVLLHGCRNPLATTERFSVGLAQTLEEVIDCQRLRYLVFNCELGEGLDSSARSGLDRDQFDFICDHLMVHDTATSELVGTYRMQSGYRAKGNLGYYGEGLFEFGPFEAIRAEVLELGRACVHQEYRNTAVLHMLWRRIARYASSCGARYEALREKYLVEPALRTQPRVDHRWEATHDFAVAPQPPRLFRAYLEISAKLCGPPLWTGNSRRLIS
jgi:putative hemolysin